MTATESNVTSENTAEAQDNHKPVYNPTKVWGTPGKPRNFVGLHTDDDVAELRSHSIRGGLTLAGAALLASTPIGLAGAAAVVLYNGIRGVQDHKMYDEIRSYHSKQAEAAKIAASD